MVRLCHLFFFVCALVCLVLQGEAAPSHWGVYQPRSRPVNTITIRLPPRRQRVVTYHAVPRVVHAAPSFGPVIHAFGRGSAEVIDLSAERFW